jgi:hypothetical protein
MLGNGWFPSIASRQTNSTRPQLGDGTTVDRDQQLLTRLVRAAAAMAGFFTTGHLLLPMEPHIH